MLTLALVAPADAWTAKTTASGEPLRWDALPIEWTWDGGAPVAVADPEGELAAAFAQWADVGGAEVAFRERPGSVPNPVEDPEDGRQLVWVTEDWPFDPDLLALTSSWAHEETGEIVAFDLRVNGNAAWASDGRAGAYDFRAALTHEVGHVLGLDHSAVESAAMFATTGPGEAWRAALDPDDEDGLRFLYPRSREEASGPFFGLSCATPSGSVGGAPLLWLAAVGLARRRVGGSHAGHSRCDGFRVDVRSGPGPGGAG